MLLLGPDLAFYFDADPDPAFHSDAVCVHFYRLSISTDLQDLSPPLLTVNVDRVRGHTAVKTLLNKMYFWIAFFIE
jgi:hypothetical protein